MAALDLTPYKPSPGASEDANQISNGFTAIQLAVNSVDASQFAAGKIFDPTKLLANGATDGQVMTYDGASGLWKPKTSAKAAYVTLGQFAALTPADGDEVYLIADAANGINWHLRYNAGSASAYKWESVGPGSGIMSVGAPLTLPRAGDYQIEVATNGTPTNLSANPLIATLGASSGALTGVTTQTIGWSASTGIVTVVIQSGLSFVSKVAGCLANATLTMGVTGGVLNFYVIRARPARIS